MLMCFHSYYQDKLHYAEIKTNQANKTTRAIISALRRQGNQKFKVFFSFIPSSKSASPRETLSQN